MTYSSSRFELRKKQGVSPPSLQPYKSSPALLSLATNDQQPKLNSSELLQGKLRLHGELIDALHQLTSQSNAGELFEPSRDVKSREVVLEQALVEQNRILDVMQELVSALESENKLCRENINSQSIRISNWEAKAKQLEREMVQRTRQLPSPPENQDLRIAELRKQLEDKNRTILSLQSRLRHEGSSVESSLMARLSSARTKLEVERVHCIEMEEELSGMKENLTRLKAKVADNESHLIGKESEILHLKHEMKTLQNFEIQQQDLVMKQRNSLASKDLQLNSVIRALNKEKKVADQLRRLYSSPNSQSLLSSRVASSGVSLDMVHPNHQASLFEQISGREAISIELTRSSQEIELGFSFGKVDLPISSRIPCLVVKAVREESLADGLLRPGDELMEVNGIMCRSAQQSKAVQVLGETVGLLKIVVAREPGPLSHSTPTRTADNSSRTALWATAVSPTTTFESFNVESMVSESGETPKYITVPELYAISTAKDSEGGSVGGDLAPAGNDPTDASNLSKSASSTAGSESLMTFNSRDDVSRRKLQDEVLELRSQLDESEHIRVNLESELDTTQEETGHLQEEHELLKAENHELRVAVATYEGEMVEIRQHISALQSALVTLEAQVTDEQQKLASMENHNRVISSELAEAKDTACLAVEAREKLELALEQSKAELEQSGSKESKMESELQVLKMENVRLASDVARMGGEIEELRDTLGESRKSAEETIAGLKQELKKSQSQLGLAREISEKSTLSSQEEYKHLTAQLKSAKSLLMEAEMKGTQQSVEGRYLKQAANLTNTQLKKLETDHQKIKDELSHFKQEAENRTVEMKSLNVNLKGTQMKLEAKQQMVIRLQEEVDNSRRASSKLRNENARLTETIKKLEIDLEASYAEGERLEEKLEASLSEKDEMFLELEKSYEESTELSLTLEEITARLEQEAKEQEAGKSLKSPETKLPHELDTSEKKQEQNLMSEQMAKYRSEMKLLESKCESATKELAQAKTENEQLCASKDNAREQLVLLQEDHVILKEEMERMRSMAEDMKSTLAQAQEQVEIERESLDESRHKVSELTSELKALAEGKKQSDDMVASLEFLQAQDQTKLEQMRLSIESKGREMQLLNKQVEDLNSLLQKSKLQLNALTNGNASLEQQLEVGRQEQAETVRDLKEQLVTRERRIAHLNDELEAQKAMGEMLHSKVKHMSEMLEQGAQDKQVMEMSIEESEKEREDLQTQNKQLQNRVAHLKVELDRLALSSDSMSSEIAGLRQQVRQNEKETDEATAQLNAAEMNLEVTTRALREAERVNSTQSERLDDLEGRYKVSESNRKDLEINLEEKLMEFFKQEEELSKMKISLDLSQNECKSLQESLIELHMTVEDLRRSASQSEEEKNQLLSSVSQLDDGKIELEDALRELEKEKETMLAQKLDEIRGHQEEIESLQASVKTHAKEVAELKALNQEAKTSISQLLSAQEELKSSVGKLGDEKDAEIIKLQEEAQTVKSQLSKAMADIDSSLENEGTLREEVEKLQQTQAELRIQANEDARKNKDLREEIDLLTVTKSEIGELAEKVTVLSESLGEKTKKLHEMETTHHSAELELNNLQSENKTLLEKALELSDLKISMAEQSESMKVIRVELEEEKAHHKQLLEERDQLLSRVREFEVSNHASHQKPEPASPTEPVSEMDMDKLKQLVEEKEDHVKRMKSYTDNLLLNVMMSAPSLLEKL
jgi:chromosome segregation ATPase